MRHWKLLQATSLSSEIWVIFDLEWDAVTDIVDENGNRVHTTLHESLRTNNACFPRNFCSKYNKQKLERLAKERNNVE